MILTQKSQFKKRQRINRSAHDFHKPFDFRQDGRKTIVKLNRNYNRKKCLKFIHTTIFISKSDKKEILLHKQDIKETYVVLSRQQKCNSQKLALEFAMQCDKQKLLLQCKKQIAKHFSTFFLTPHTSQIKQNLSKQVLD